MKLLMTMCEVPFVPPFIVATSESRAAQITDPQSKFSLLCVAEQGTGFNWQNSDWVQSRYRSNSYILTKVEPFCFKVEQHCSSDSQSISDSDVWGRGESHGCYELREIGQKHGRHRCREPASPAQ